MLTNHLCCLMLGGRGFSGCRLFFSKYDLFLQDTNYWRHLSHILTDELNNIFKKSDVWNRFVCSRPL